MIRRTGLFALLLLASACTAPPPVQVAAPAAPVVPPPPPAPVCEIAANGGPVLTERGIGGTGKDAERGIGGTGITAEDLRMVERGIGGTGITRGIPRTVRSLGPNNRPVPPEPRSAIELGVITGFHSVCLDGTEVAVDGSVPMRIDGATVQGTALRAGQVAMIETAADAAGTHSLRLAVRHELVGPVEHAGNGTMVIAGQTVAPAAGAWGMDAVHPGAWVAVSGLRRPDGSVLATRFDPAPRGKVTIRGPVTVTHGVARIGDARLAIGAHRPADGSFVVATGRWSNGVLVVERLEPDPVAQDPLTAFGDGVRRITERAVVRVEPGRVWLNAGLSVPLADGVTLEPSAAADLVLTLERGADGAYAVTHAKPAAAP
jgi:hypothetical protein